MKKIKERKKRESKILLLCEYNNLETKDKVQALETIKDRLRIIAHSIIGEKNAITPFKLFETIYSKDPSTFDIFRRSFYYNIIKNTMRYLRSSGEIFFIIKPSKIFVLESEEELEKFKNRIDNDIKSLEHLKENAEEWVKNKKYKKLKRSMFEEILS